MFKLSIAALLCCALAGCAGRRDDGAGWLYKAVQHCQAGEC